MKLYPFQKICPLNMKKGVEGLYADNFTAGGSVRDLIYWWETLCKLDLKFGYYPEASKT